MRILVASPIDPATLAALRADHDVVERLGASEDGLAEVVTDRQVVIFRSGVSISRRVLDAAPALRALVRAGSGLDNLDLDTVQARGISLHRVPGPGAQAVAELTFALFLGLARRVVVADQLLRRGHWAKSELVGVNLTEKTLGIVGVGSIGGRVGALGRAWGMNVVGCVDHWSEERRLQLATDGIELVPDCATVLAAADFASIHVPLNDATRGMIGDAALARMRPTAYLVNIARGGVVDEMALHRALVEERLAGAALDVHVREGEGKISPLAELPNVILTPHIGAATSDAQRQIGVQIVEIIAGLARDQERTQVVPA
ncbi:MAG: NAD(P)-dependent oxidoreductase [Chloroflexota bacterium]